MAKKNASATLTAPVTTEATVTSPEAALTNSKTPRNKSVTTAAFIMALKAGSAAEPKQTGQQVADILEMNKTSFDQRLNGLRTEWRDSGFIHRVKFGGATAETENMTTEAYDAEVVRVKELNEGKKFAVITEADAVFNGPFPWTLADGRSMSGGNGKSGTVHNALLAALAEVE